MAIWQYQLNIIPKNAVLDKYGEIPEKLFIDEKGWEKYWENVNYDNGFPEPDFEDARTIKWWRNTKLNIRNTANHIDKLVKRGDWSNDKDLIGWKGNTENKEDNDCQISFDEKTEEIGEFYFRTDLRNKENAMKFMNGMLEICSKNNLMVMNTEGYLFEPNSELIFEDLRKSNAVKFLTDPVKFIEKVVENEGNLFKFSKKRKDSGEK
ncbi:hypothetical protein ATE84_0861 [Aquimarina sp. MAR_2010_214]|uniref:hypothetical protein n=1 Tax=Aquimarina sp. MAR_2010_214 TaxID=1250026 RepID=UPI000C6FF54D|nr:hypothetical protein [Aquimarina sp. MAR_2010_214]PKV48847.1 hypothetical protein ATE84_0861 [Aquimarina sp. MAR_2010_214]